MVRLIFGCGYLGLRVAKIWLDQGDEVIALSRDPVRLEQRAKTHSAAGLTVIGGDITDPSSLPKLPEADTVLFAVGMDRTRYQDIQAVYVEGLKNLLPRLPEETGRLIYISSTGVYGKIESQQSLDSEQAPWVDEATPAYPNRPGGHACLEAETLLRSCGWSHRTTILRFAGIYGPDRIPLSQAVATGQWNQLNPEGHLNLIHVLDGSQIISRFADMPTAGEVFLVSDGKPVERRKFYETMAALMGNAPIDWSLSLSTDGANLSKRGSDGNKRISNQKLMSRLSYRFLYPDYVAGLTSLLAPNAAR